MISRARPLGVTLMVFFFVFGTTAASLTILLLLFPGGPMDSLWRLNPRAHEGFAAMGWWAVVLMPAVAAACATAALGLWQCARWGYFTAAAILCINLLGDAVNVFISHDWRALVGLPVGGAMLFYLLARRDAFT